MEIVSCGKEGILNYKHSDMLSLLYIYTRRFPTISYHKTNLLKMLISGNTALNLIETSFYIMG